MTSSDDVQRFLCPNGTYNDMATLFYNPQEDAIKLLFHHTGLYTAGLLKTDVDRIYNWQKHMIRYVL